MQCRNSYVDINTQTGGYDIQATAYFKGLPDQSSSAFNSSLVSHGIQPQDFAAIGERTTTAGCLQLGAAAPRWSLYPAQIVSGGFLQGYGLHLSARAEGLNSDSAVFQELRTHPDYALIDSSALPDNPNGFSLLANPTATSIGTGAAATPPGFDADSTFKMSGVYQGESSFPAVPVWIVGVKGLTATKVTVIGVVDNSDGAHYGLYLSRALYDPQQALAIGGTDNNGGVGSTPRQSYYLKAAPGQDVMRWRSLWGSAYLDNGLETTVLSGSDLAGAWTTYPAQQYSARCRRLDALLGVAALALTGTRAVIERRQQIGMLRAMGSSRHLIQGAFLLKSFFVGTWGSVMGIVLGVIFLVRNIFAANFFEQYQTGLTFHIPWQELGIIIIVSLLASLLGALLPARCGITADRPALAPGDLLDRARPADRPGGARRGCRGAPISSRAVAEPPAVHRRGPGVGPAAGRCRPGLLTGPADPGLVLLHGGRQPSHPAEPDPAGRLSPVPVGAQAVPQPALLPVRVEPGVGEVITPFELPLLKAV